VTTYVIDANVAVKWYVAEPQADRALRLLASGHDLHAPDLVHAEAGNVLWKLSRRGVLSPDEALRIARALLATPLRIHASAGLLEGALDIAERTNRTVYDGMYVALAVALDGVLVTADQRLANALEKTPFGPHVLWLEDLP
jgi:predicted nucleic acid-binding protein